MAIANIVASAAIATTGNKLQELQSTAQKLEAQNQELERSVASGQSFARIETRAEDLGLTDQATSVTITSIQPVALLP